jgi:hypothetical protein
VPRLGSPRRSAVFAACLTSAALALGASSASAVTIGQLAPDVPPEESCFGGPFDVLQPTVTSGNGYVVPSTGGVTNWTLTSWSTNNRGMTGDIMGLKLFRKVGDPDIYKVVGHEGPHSLASGINTFSAHLQVQAGDVLGAHSGGGDCAFDAPGNTILFLQDTDLPDGGQRQFDSDVPFLLNETAEVTPVNDFSLSALKAKKNGTAVVTLSLPNPGDLAVSGKGLKGSVSAVSSTAVNAGTVNLVIRAKGKKKRKLARKGKVKVTPTISYTPTGGTASSQTTKVKLRRK